MKAAELSIACPGQYSGSSRDRVHDRSMNSRKVESRDSFPGQSRAIPELPRRGNVPRVIIGGLIFMAGLFLMIPWSQWINSPQSPTLAQASELETFHYVADAAPVEEPEPVVQNNEIPEMTFPESVRPATNEAANVDTSRRLPVATDSGQFTLPQSALSSGNWNLGYSFDDLSQAPSLINVPEFRFPRELLLEGVNEGKVVVEIRILPDGRAELIRIVSATHDALRRVARNIIADARFTKPMIGGEYRTVRGYFPLNLEN